MEKELIDKIEKELIEKFYAQFGYLTLMAALDDTKRRNLRLVLFPLGKHGGTVNYCKKTRKFTFIEYSLKGVGKRISI